MTPQPELQQTAGIQGKRCFTLLLFCHVVASYWNQVIAKRNIKNGEEILAAYGTKYAPRLKKNVADLKKESKTTGEGIGQVSGKLNKNVSLYNSKNFFFYIFL